VTLVDNSSWSYSALRGATKPIPLAAFAIPAEQLAQDLLGTVLFHRKTAGLIVETEAYLGEDDLAAHAARGVTERTKVIFGPAGRAYVYQIYGIYECLNVVADRPGKAGCVLIRALEPLTGLRLMAQRRPRYHGPVSGLANGPGKLTMALAITRQQYGQRLDRGSLAIRQWREKRAFGIGTTPRIGISKCIDWPLRFVVAGHACVSK
jgi:DNA-3-methyladenine glycosylase